MQCRLADSSCSSFDKRRVGEALPASATPLPCLQPFIFLLVAGHKLHEKKYVCQKLSHHILHTQQILPCMYSSPLRMYYTNRNLDGSLFLGGGGGGAKSLPPPPPPQSLAKMPHCRLQRAGWLSKNCDKTQFVNGKLRACVVGTANQCCTCSENIEYKPTKVLFMSHLICSL